MDGRTRMPPGSLLDSQPSEAHFLHNVVDRCRDGGEKHDGVWQVAPFFCRIPFSAEGTARLRQLDEEIKRDLPALHKYGNDRARRAYRSEKDTLTKPSYIGRLRNFGGENLGCQLGTIGAILRHEPTSGGLVFSVFHPEDLRSRPRPGYVPCLVCGSFLVHDGEFHINAFFRSQSVVEFGLHDLLFLRQIQQEVFDGLTRTRGGRHLKLGSLNLFLGRVIVQRRIARRSIVAPGRPRKYLWLPRDKVVPIWSNIVARFL
jgi:hypothetical protein